MVSIKSNTQKDLTKIDCKLLKRLGIYMKPKDLLKEYAGISEEEMFKDILNRYKMPYISIKKLILERINLTKKHIKEKVVNKN